MQNMMFFLFFAISQVDFQTFDRDCIFRALTMVMVGSKLCGTGGSINALYACLPENDTSFPLLSNIISDCSTYLKGLQIMGL